MNWELLYRALHHRDKDDHEDRTEMGLHEIYGLCLPDPPSPNFRPMQNTEPNQPIQRGPSPYRPQPQSEEVKIRIQRKNIVTLHTSIEFPPEDGNIYDSRGNEIKDHLDKYMFVPTKSNNKGFEMVMFEEKANGGGYIAINIECKFSWPDSKTVLSSKEIKEKYKHMKDKYLPHVNQKRQSKESPVRKLRMEIGDIYLILVVWRDIGKLDDEILNNKNIIIVGRKELEKFYSPSLVSRPQFYGDIQKKIEN
ncbi:unnamed protein product [Rhizophagus irregularis]|nr:unnamed protein product [Rhizophagus irregularis]CAB5370640.1 unnamed protein product [Rhizophagus irregularis]